MKRPFIFALLVALAPASASPPLPPGVQVTDPSGNPLRAALRPVPVSAVFRMDGWYLWDPSVIKVGDTWHLFASRWPAAEKMNGWFRSHVIRATSKSLFGPYEFHELVSQEPVWSQNDPLPLTDGTSLTVAGVERPQVCLDERGAVIALLASAYPAVKESAPTFIIIRPVDHFLPANSPPPPP